MERRQNLHPLVIVVLVLTVVVLALILLGALSMFGMMGWIMGGGMMTGFNSGLEVPAGVLVGFLLIGGLLALLIWAVRRG